VRRRLFAQVQSDADLDPLGLAGWHHVRFHHEIAARFEGPCHTVRRHARRLPWRPAQEVAVRKSGLATAAPLVSRPRLLLVQAARRPRPIDLDVGVVDRRKTARVEFQGLDVAPGVAGNRHDERAKYVRAAARQHVRFWHADHEVGLAELPAACPVRDGRELGRIAAQEATIGPFLQRRKLLRAQPSRAFEIAVARLGLPRRHGAVRRDLQDLARVRAHVVIGQQAEWGGLTGPMTGGALGPQDWRNIFVEGDRDVFRFWPLGAGLSLRRQRGASQNDHQRKERLRSGNTTISP
jgi:hypothetical protein